MAGPVGVGRAPPLPGLAGSPSRPGAGGARPGPAGGGAGGHAARDARLAGRLQGQQPPHRRRGRPPEANYRRRPGGARTGSLGGNAAAAGRTSDPAAAPARPDLRLHVGCPAGGRDRFHRGYGDGCRAALPGRRSVGGLAEPTGGSAWVGLSFFPADRRARRCHRARGPQRYGPIPAASPAPHPPPARRAPPRRSGRPGRQRVHARAEPSAGAARSGAAAAADRAHGAFPAGDSGGNLIQPNALDPAATATVAGYAPVLEITRGGLPESLHFGALAVADAAGRLLAAWGDPETATFLRSSAKPLQGLAVLESGAADRFGFTPAQVALMCASHSGTDAHAEGGAGMLAAIGLGGGDLLCGTPPPLDAAVARRLEAAGTDPGPLRHNCSGKHAGMLALGEFLKVKRQAYLDQDGPVQQCILSVFAEMCGLKPDQVGLGTDGCSAPNFSVPLRAAASAYARLMDPAGLPQERAAACNPIP